MVLLLRKLYLYFTKDPEGVPCFPGGVKHLPGGGGGGGGGGPNAHFFRNPCTYLLFSRAGLENSTRPLIFMSASGCRASGNFDISSENLIFPHICQCVFGCRASACFKKFRGLQGGCPDPLSPLDPNMGNVIITEQYLSQSRF